ncbi:MAG: FAD-dependent oxidoreductase [Acidobacteriota bacterium]|nr:FAD-dependent oxidoreductase [Acidobacteriota bacterium]
MAVIGSGPAGFYAAGHLLADSGGLIEVDMFERLPTPWGLVRSGVAPDHPKIKSVTRVYEKTAAHPRFRYFGHVELGADVSRAELAEHYHAIVYATGSPTDRPLGIPGEDLPGSLAATDFVGWYNAHPDFRDLDVDLGTERAVVIGNGNVALDVARMLVLAHHEVAATDTADHAIEALRESGVREVIVAGRRGPAQAAFTNPELRELADMDGVDVIVDPAELDRALAVQEGEMDATTKRNVATLSEYAERAERGAQGRTASGESSPEERRRIVLRFLVSPVELRGGESGVSEVELVHNELRRDESGSLRAVPTERREVIAAGLVLRAIGYRGAPLPDVPFDPEHCVIPNVRGRVLDPESGEPRPGEYVVGWIKRGPSGVIGTNKKDAQETVDAILEDLAADRLPEPARPGAGEVEEMLRARKPDLVTYAGWSEIDRHERERGEPHGRPRSKLTAIEEMLEVAAAATPSAEETAGARAGER